MSVFSFTCNNPRLQFKIQQLTLSTGQNKGLRESPSVFFKKCQLRWSYLIRLTARCLFSFLPLITLI